jgi:hypothetical protein
MTGASRRHREFALERVHGRAAPQVSESVGRSGALPDRLGRISQGPVPRRSQAALLLGPRVALARALERAFGDADHAQRFLHDTLRECDLDEVPTGEPRFEEFVRDEVLSRLVVRVPLHEVHELVRRVLGEEGERHAPPLRAHGLLRESEVSAKARARVVLVEPEGELRRARARALIAAGYDVEIVAQPAALLSTEPFHAVVMRLDQDGEDLAMTMAELGTRAGLVAIVEPSHPGAVSRVLARWPNERFAVAPAGADVSMICGRVRTVLVA